MSLTVWDDVGDDGAPQVRPSGGRFNQSTVQQMTYTFSEIRLLKLSEELRHVQGQL